jgi:hypothetical protein
VAIEGAILTDFHILREGPLRARRRADFGGAPPHRRPSFRNAAEAEQTTNKQRGARRICLVRLARRDTIVAQEASLQADANPLQALTPTKQSNG